MTASSSSREVGGSSCPEKMIQKAELFVLPAHMSATDLHQSLKRSAIIILSVAQVSSHGIGILLNLKAGTRLEALIKLLLDNSALIVLCLRKSRKE